MKQKKLKSYTSNKTFFLMLAPTIIYFFIFAYLPMSGIILAFKDFKYNLGVFQSPWVGFDNFRFFVVSGQAFSITRNTILYNVAFIAFETVLAITIAIFLTEVIGKYFVKITQSVIFLPYFISWVVMSAVFIGVFNYEVGIWNGIITKLGFERLDIYTNIGAWKYLLVSFRLIKSVGYFSILYLAAIAGISSEMYEAAKIDGASIFHEIKYITLPSIIPTLVTILLLDISRILRGDFELFYQLVGNNPIVLESTDVIETFVVRSMLTTQDLGMPAAAGLYQSIFCFAIIMITNYIVKRNNAEYALF